MFRQELALLSFACWEDARQPRGIPERNPRNGVRVGIVVLLTPHSQPARTLA
jgi:hypothetical protein